MAKTRIELNSAGVLALLKSTVVKKDLTRRGNAIHAALPTGDGEKWYVNSFVGHDRAQTVVRTANQAARLAAAEDFALQRALDRGR